MTFSRTLTQVNRCDLASAKLELKAVGQENNRLLSKARGQAGRIRELEVSHTAHSSGRCNSLPSPELRTLLWCWRRFCVGFRFVWSFFTEEVAEFCP